MTNQVLTGDTATESVTETTARYLKTRHLKDVMTRYMMAVGGIGVIIAIVLIAVYLFYVVVPMFMPAEVDLAAEYRAPGDSSADTLYYAMEEQAEIGLRADNQGKLVFFDVSDGRVLQEHDVLPDSDAAITAFDAGDPSQELLAYGLSDGSVLLVQHRYKITYPDDKRLISPGLYYPMGREPTRVSEDGSAITQVSAQYDGDNTTIAAVTANSELHLVSLAREESFLSDEAEITRSDAMLPLSRRASHMILDVDQRELYLANDDGSISYYDTSDKSAPVLIEHVQRVVPDDVRITSLEFLSGGISVLVGDSRGHINQWFPVRDENNDYSLQWVRGFSAQDHPITDITPEYFRKGFIAADESGTYGIYHTTAHRTVKVVDAGISASLKAALGPRADALLLEDGRRQLQFWRVHNEHPEISWQSLWGKVWYESRAEPELIWQSSSASSDFEPKFSLSPLAFGTFKAAFYAMLFAIPLAILGAIYTAYFMTPKMRSMVKPTIEIMEALPTVILGFLAGLWLAPFVELHLPGIFMILLLLPVSILLASYGWFKLPDKIKKQVPEGWEAALLIPVVVLATTVAIALSIPVEKAFFGGNMPLWLTNEMGIGYDQRNSLVVGVAMGFAVIPTIFSISEDAIYSVPKHLTTGSLSLGATPWQTMMRVVLLTASPGIFSALMIGLGRAVGETMIVVMATGNTAIMDMNIFEGFRALSANIAVEMPESEVGGTHYRVLFLAALVLFMATFVFNTAAEVVRQRLRIKYSSL
jgi:phosphate transport system permease protein